MAEFIGSKEKAKNGYGQNAYQGASSDLPGQHTTTPPTSGVAPSQAQVPGLAHEDTLGARVAMGDDGKAAAITPHAGMLGKPANSGSPSGPVPAATVRRDSGKSLLR